jgi:hypothetical protein
MKLKCRSAFRLFLPFLLFPATVFAGVTVSSPSSGSNQSSSVHFVASGTTSCSKGVSAMGIYTAAYVKAYVVGGSKLDTTLNLAKGSYNTTVVAWDNCGGASTKGVSFTVTSGGTVMSNLQSKSGWKGWAQYPPKYDICTSCSPSGPQITWYMTKGASPSLSGNSTRFGIGGTTPYSDVLWNNHLIGDLSSQGVPDSNHTLVSKLHNFVYDVYFYGTNLGASEALEFDIHQVFNGKAFMFGHECRVNNGHEWAVWDASNRRWVGTGISCYLLNNTWNHLVLTFQRTSDGHLLYKTIRFNGVTHTVNRYYWPDTAPGSWWGIAINYQMDGNYKQQPYSVVLDRLNFQYW